MIHNLPATPTVAVAAVTCLIVVALCVNRVLTTAIRSAQPGDIPKIINTLCRHIANRRR